MAILTRFIMTAALVFLVLIPATCALTLEEAQAYIEANQLDWTAGENSLSHLSTGEFRQMLRLELPADYVEPPEPEGLDPDPFNGRASWDWRDHNGVTAVKNQGGCGSCWAFCTTGMVESFILIYDGLNWDLSEQQLVLCNNQGYDCGGGWIYPQHYISPGGVFESCMPYTASDSGPCTESSCDKVAFIDDWDQISSSVTSIKNALVDGPVAVAMYAFDDLHYYTGGCYSHGSSSSVNHGVLIVGYDDSMCSNQGAWLVKNSWGSGWGENGFFWIKYGDSNIGYGATRIYYTASGTVDLSVASGSVDDSVYGNGSGQIDPGERAQIIVTAGNAGTTTATGVGAILSCTTAGVTVEDNFASFPDIGSGQQQPSQSPHFTVNLSDTVSPGTSLTFTVSFSANQGSYSDTFTLMVGSTAMPTQTPPPPTNTPIPTWTPIPTNTQVPTWTAAPSQTPAPTFTGMPTWTPGPPATPTPPPQNTPAPTDTPDNPEFTSTPEPQDTPEPTGTPESWFTQTLSLSGEMFRDGDTFLLTLSVDNQGPAFFADQYLVLQVGEMYWFWPNWTPDLQHQMNIYNEGLTEETILNFTWPQVDGSGQGYMFHALMCKPGTAQVFSNLSTVTFGFE